MDLEQVGSKSFQLAALKSESYRIVGLLYLLVGVALFAVILGMARGRPILLAVQLAVLGLIAAYEFYMLSAVRKAINAGSEITPFRWYLNIIIESQFPTLGIFLLVISGVFTPMEALVAPGLLLYYFFIILSTLRLSPKLSIVSGAASAIGYLAVTIYAFSAYRADDNLAVSMAVYFIYAALILLAGGVAAFVAGQIRDHVTAALREAELQRQLDRVGHDLDVARNIQQGLLPIDPPKLDEFDIAGWNQPADQTGGDYFDWQELPDGRIAVSLADATGHGIGPALVGTSCRAYARASLLSNGHDGGVLGRLNTLLADDLESNRFVTFCVIFLDPKSAAIEISSAGHGPILWYKEAIDKVETIEAQGIPLGMLGGFDYDDGTIGTLGPGDFIALVTDGFFEWENGDGEDYGVSRMEQTLRDSRHMTAGEMIETLRASVAEFCGGTAQMDDLTAVILKRKHAQDTPRG